MTHASVNEQRTLIMGLQIKHRICPTFTPASGATPGAAVGLPIKYYSLTSHLFKWPVIAALSTEVQLTHTSPCSTIHSFFHTPSRETTQSTDSSWVTCCCYTILLYRITFCCIVSWLQTCMCSICMPSSHKVYAYKYDCCPSLESKVYTFNSQFALHCTHIQV